MSNEEKRKLLTNKDWNDWEDFFFACDDNCSKCSILVLCDTIINHESKLKEILSAPED